MTKLPVVVISLGRHTECDTAGPRQARKHWPVDYTLQQKIQIMQILRTATLAEIRDGILAHQLDAELAKIHADCVDRPNLKKARKVSLEITVTPIGDDPLDAVDVEFQIKSSIPATKIVRPMKSLKKRNGFGFDGDTDSVSHAPTQKRLARIDKDEDGDDDDDEGSDSV